MTDDTKERLPHQLRVALARIEDMGAKIADLEAHVQHIHDTSCNRYLDEAIAAERKRCADVNFLIRTLGNSVAAKSLHITAIKLIAQDIAAAIKGRSND